MEIKYRGHKDSIQKSKQRCLAIATDYNSGISINDLCKKYPNSKTKKPCSRVYIYWALKKAQSIN